MNEEIIRGLFNINDDEIHEQIGVMINSKMDKVEEGKIQNKMNFSDSKLKKDITLKISIDDSERKFNKERPIIMNKIYSLNENLNVGESKKQNDIFPLKGLIDEFQRKEEIKGTININKVLPNEKEITQKRYLFSLCDNFILIFCKCFASR